MENNKEKYWRNKIIEWEKSGLSQIKFCTEKDIRLSTFQYWRGRLNKLQKKEKFIPVMIPGRENSPKPILEFSVSDDLRISIKFNFQSEELLKLKDSRNGN